MINWKQMPYFLAVARLGSLRSAAKYMDATHATVRRQIEALEMGTGVQLFRRHRSGLEMTAAGKTLFPKMVEVEKIVIEANNGLKGLDREAKGLIKISLDPMAGHFLMAPIFADFCNIYPDIELEIRLTYEIEDIEGFETDISIRQAAKISDDVVVRKLFPADTGIYANWDYINNILPKAGPKGENLSWIGYGEVPEQKEWINASPFPNAKIRHIVQDTEMHLHLVRAGMGMTFLPIWLEKQFINLQRVPGTKITHNRFVWMLVHSDLKKITRVKLFVDYMISALQRI